MYPLTAYIPPKELFGRKRTCSQLCTCQFALQRTRCRSVHSHPCLHRSPGIWCDSQYLPYCRWPDTFQLRPIRWVLRWMRCGSPTLRPCIRFKEHLIWTKWFHRNFEISLLTSTSFPWADDIRFRIPCYLECKGTCWRECTCRSRPEFHLLGRSILRSIVARIRGTRLWSCTYLGTGWRT